MKIKTKRLEKLLNQYDNIVVEQLKYSLSVMIKIGIPHNEQEIECLKTTCQIARDCMEEINDRVRLYEHFVEEEEKITNEKNKSEV